MKGKSLIMAILLSVFSLNTVSAQIVNISNSNSTSSTNTSTSDKIKVIKENLEYKSQKEENGGTVGSGGSSISVAFGYLTPTKQFGYISMNNYRYVDNEKNPDEAGYRGNIVPARDDLQATSQGWGVGYKSDVLWPQGPMLNYADAYYKNYVLGEIEEVDVDDFKNSSCYIQYKGGGNATSGKPFIASTLYVRWMYDVTFGSEKNKDRSGNLLYAPLASNGGGPYLMIGEHLDNDEGGRVITQNDKKETIINESEYQTVKNRVASGYAVKASSLVSGNTKFDYFGTDYDLKVNSYTNNNAVMEKRYEARVYLENANQLKYEAVVPVKTVTTNKTIQVPDTLPKVSVTSKTVYDSSNKVQQYEFETSVTKKDATYDYGSSTGENKKVYTIKKDKNDNLGTDSSKGNEPGENQLDVWHTNIKVNLNIKDSNGNLILSKPVDVDSNGNLDKKVIIYPSEVGYRSLDGCTVYLDVGFSSNIRYMSDKVDYSLTYRKEDGTNLGNYAATIKYVTDVANESTQKSVIETDISKNFDSVNPRIEKTYKTATDNNLSVTASAKISVVEPNADKLKSNISVDVSVNPPNALTKIEGGKFDVMVDANLTKKDPNLTATGSNEYKVNNMTDIPNGEVGETEWLDNFKIDRIYVEAADGSVILDQTNGFEITSDTEEKVAAIVRDVEANPTQIGKATVTVYYSYDHNYRKWDIQPGDKYELNAQGQSVPTSWIIKTDTTVTPQTGTAVGYFNIYSLSGVTKEA